ncbi:MULTISPECIES: GNAT family N-acetyltransferase [unclassified Streptomyces]|uniref:GNAT family N-acetyltransferase n=1 Tax=unclassified Streptomyces TaxID=2593676 RepID=UPI00380006D6
MALRFTLDPELTADLRSQLVTLWTDVTNAGGAVGFVAPVTAADVAPQAEGRCEAISGGRAHLIAGFEDGRLAATAFLTLNTHRLMGHWAWLYTVMVDPAHQGRGHGADLLREAERAARELGLEGLRLTCRSGMGLDRFYASVGYKEVGRTPGAIRIAAGDDRDEITMWLPLL